MCLEDVAAFARVQSAVLGWAAVAPLARELTVLGSGARTLDGVAGAGLPAPSRAALPSLGSDQHLYLHNAYRRNWFLNSRRGPSPLIRT